VGARVEFFWDPICPFAWITSRWLVQVVEPRQLEVDWRFLSLRVLNEGKDYERDFPAGYPVLHDRGLRMLRVAAAVRDAHGNGSMQSLYTAYGESIWNRAPRPAGSGDLFDGIGDGAHLRAVLGSLGLPDSFAGAADDESFDDALRTDTAEARRRAGDDVGTPVIGVEPPDGPAFFGPVMSRVPEAAEAVELWDSLMTLVRWPGFAEVKRSLREVPRLPLLG
jgi:2-hydroxychromene-2-carboxylate isomerase